MVIKNNLLPAALLQYLKHKEPNVATYIKYLIEEGHNIISAAQEICLARKLNSNNFNQLFGEFLPILNAKSIYSKLQVMGIESGFVIRTLKCNITNSIPTIPVLHNHKMYDLFHLCEKLEIKPNRGSIYAFLLDGKKIDSQSIQFDHEYIAKLARSNPKNNMITHTIDHAATLIIDQRFILAAIILKNLLPYNTSYLEASPGYRIPYDMLTSFVIFCSALVRYDPFSDSFNTINEFFNMASKLNMLYAIMYSIMCFFSNLYILLFFESISKSNNICHKNEDFLNNIHYLFNAQIYLTIFLAHTMASIILTPKATFAEKFIKPKTMCFSPVFQKDMITPRQAQKTALTICFNKMIGTGNAPVQFGTNNPKEQNDMIEKILDMNFGEKPRFQLV